MNAQAVALKKSNFEIELENYEPQIAAALPSHVSPDKFRRVVMTAVARQPELYTEADRRSLFNSCVQCASDGLLPDNREAALVIFNTKDKKSNSWIKAVQYMPMIAGILKRMRNTGEVASADSYVVYQNDKFSYRLGDHAEIIHEPTLGDPGPVIGAYAIIRLTNGEILREVMPKAQIDKVRAVSRSGDNDKGPWAQWYGEMARKSVLRRCAKRAPVSPDLERLLSRDDVPEPPTSLPPPPRPTRQSIAASVEPEREVDPAAAGHEDLDERFRQTVAHDEDGVIEDSQAARAGGASPEGPQAVVAEAPSTDDARARIIHGTDPAVSGAGDVTDWPALAQQLKEGADDQAKVTELDEYYGLQRASIAALEKGDPKLGAEVMAYLNARRKKLLAEKAGGGK